MNQLDDMLAGLSSEGALEARREFQIDSAKAREKLQKFQLEDPHFYVLELVQAAHLLGATEIRFAIDADEMELYFDGDILTRLELEELYSAAFARLTDRRKQAMRHLAIGFNAAQALLPSRIELQVASDADADSLLLVSSPDQERDEITEVAAPAGFKGTRVYLRESFRTGHLVEFFHNLKGTLAEKTALRERCLYSHIPVFLDGEQISKGHVLPDDLLGVHPFRTEQERGVLGVYSNKKASTLIILQNGVHVTTVHAPSGLANTVAVVDSQRLSKNLSQSAFVEDKQWSYLLGQVLRLEMHDSLARYFEKTQVIDMRGVIVASPQAWIVDAIEEVAAEIQLYREHGRALPEQTERLASLLERWQCIPLSHKLGRGGVVSDDNKISIGQLRELLGDRRTITFSPLGYDELEVDALSPVVYGSAERLGWLRQWLGYPLKNVTIQLDQMNRRSINYKRWQAQPKRSGSMLSTRFRIRVPFDCGGGIEGVWAIDPSEWNQARITRTAEGRMLFIKEGRLLSRRALEGIYFKGVNLVFSGEIAENELFDGPTEDGVMFSHYLRALEKFVDVFDKLATYFGEVGFTEHGYSYFLNLINTQLAGDLASLLLNQMGAPVREFPQELAQWKMKQQQQGSFWGLMLSSMPERATRIKALGAMADIPFFVDFVGERCSLREIDAQIEKHGKIGVYDGTITATLREDWEVAKLEQRVYLIGRGLESAVLSQIASARYYRYMGQVIRRHALANRYLERPEVSVQLPEHVPFARTREYDDGQNKGVIGLEWAAPSPEVWDGGIDPSEEPKIKVKLLYKQRLLKEFELSAEMGQFRAVLDVRSLRPNASWDGVIEDSQWMSLRRDLYAAAAEMLAEHCKDLISRLSELDSYAYLELWIYIWQAQVAKFPGGSHEFGSVRELIVSRPVFSIHGGAPIGLLELSSLVHRRNELFVVSHGGEVLDALLPDGPQVRVLVIPALFGEVIEEWLKALLGREYLRVIDVTDTSEAQKTLEEARARYMSREVLPLVVPARPIDVLYEHEITGHDSIRGRLGMLFDGDPMRSYPGIAIEILVQERRATTTSMELFLGRFTSRIESDRVTLAGNYEDVNQDVYYREVLTEMRRLAHESLSAHLKQRIEEGLIPFKVERDLFESYLVRVSQMKDPGSHIERHIVTLLKELPLFELLDCPRGRALATGPQDAPPFVSLDELASLFGQNFVWVDSKMSRDRIPAELNAPVVILRDMTHRKKLAPVLDRLSIPDLADHIRKKEEEERKQREREQRRIEAQQERERARERERLERERLERERLAREAEEGEQSRRREAAEALAQQRRAREEQRRAELEEAERALQGDSAREGEKESVIVSMEHFSLTENAPEVAPEPEAMPEPEPIPEPEPLPEPEPPDPAELLLEEIAVQLRYVRGERSDLLGDPILSRLSVIDRLPGDLVADVSKSDVKVAREHAAMRYALEAPDDPIARAFLSSSVYSAINLYYEKITDADEQVFQERMLEAILQSSH
jgi:hypothetical protein